VIHRSLCAKKINVDLTPFIAEGNSRWSRTIEK